MAFRNPQVPSRLSPQPFVAWTPQALLSLRFQRAANAANEANLKRYRRSLREARRLRDQNAADVAQLGATQETDIREGYRDQQAQVRQGLTQRGLAHSTVLPTMLQGVTRDRNRDLQSLREGMARTRVGVRSGDTDRIISLMASRTDRAPDPSMLANLSQGLGQSPLGGGMVPNYQAMQQAMAMRAMAPQLYQQQMMMQGGPGPTQRSPAAFMNRVAIGMERRAREAERLERVRQANAQTQAQIPQFGNNASPPFNQLNAAQAAQQAMMANAAVAANQGPGQPPRDNKVLDFIMNQVAQSKMRSGPPQPAPAPPPAAATSSPRNMPGGSLPGDLRNYRWQIASTEPRWVPEEALTWTKNSGTATGWKSAEELNKVLSPGVVYQTYDVSKEKYIYFVWDPIKKKPIYIDGTLDHRMSPPPDNRYVPNQNPFGVGSYNDLSNYAG